MYIKAEDIHFIHCSTGNIIINNDVKLKRFTKKIC